MKKRADVIKSKVNWKHCPHSNLRGVFGDEIIFGTPGMRRLQCMDCYRFLDGPVVLAEIRKKNETKF